MNVNNEDKSIILFDGVCNLCVWSIQFVISRDVDDIFRFVSFQSKKGQLLMKQYSLHKDSVVLIQNNTVKKKSTAVISILYHLHTIWKLLIIFYVIPYPIRDFLYHILVKTRYFLFGKRDKCMVPNKNINSKFLSL